MQPVAAIPPGRLGWLGRLAPQERRAFWAAFGGNALDNLDFSLFSFLIPTLTVTWGMSRAEAGLIATSTAISGAVGGVVAGALADRFGRVRILQITILWFSVFTFLCGFAQNPDQLLLARTLQGLGFGGELAVGAVLIGEAVRPADRGKIMGGVASGYAVGAIAASCIYALVYLLFPPELAWRWALWTGILPALLVLYIRRGVEEPEVYLSGRQERRTAGSVSLLGPSLIGRTLPAVLLVAGVTAAQLTFAIWLPTWLRAEHGLSVANTSLYAIVNYIGALIGFLSGGYFVDWMGRRNAFRIFALISFVGVCIYLLLPLPSLALVPLGILVGIAFVVMGVGMTPYLTELFPTAVRGSGLGLCYSLGRAVGALSVGLVGLASGTIPLGWAIAMVIAANLLLVALIATLLPETAGRALTISTP